MIFRTLTFLLSIVFLLSTATSLAQKLTLGLNAGANLSTIRYDAYDTKFKVGPTAGIHISWRLSENLRLRLEALGERKGARQEINLTDANGTAIGTDYIAQHLDYFTVPVMLQYAFGKKTWKPIACAGASWGFLIEETQEIPNVNYGVHNTPYFKKSDLSLFTGLGLEAPLGSMASFQIQGRTVIGLTDLEGKKPENPVASYAGTNLSFLLMAGVQLHIN